MSETANQLESNPSAIKLYHATCKVPMELNLQTYNFTCSKCTNTIHLSAIKKHIDNNEMVELRHKGYIIVVLKV